MFKFLTRIFVYPIIKLKCRKKLAKELGYKHFPYTFVITEWGDGNYKIECKGAYKGCGSYIIKSITYHCGIYEKNYKI